MAEDKLINTLESWQEKYLAAIGQGIKKYDIVGSGALGKSLKINQQPKVKLFGTTYKMQITAMPYWEQLNEGRGKSTQGSKPGVLQGKIEEWLRLPNVRQKLTKGKPYAEGSDKGWTEARYKSAAFAIARNIHNNGYEARPFITEARKKIDNDMVKGVADAAAEETEFRISEIINFVNNFNK
jgi:hypothetical protein